jgi:3-dehydroquinate synthase
MQHITGSGYSIYFNNDCYAYLQQLLVQDSYSKIFIIADENTSQYCLPNFLAQLATEIPIEIIEIEAGEINKNIETCTQVWHALTELGADRKSIVINVGGGVVTDLGGFAASTFKRGMDFVNVPTSLLAMVDASVGGKTGVDLGVLKNQIGIITNPVAVLIDTQFLETLPAAEMRSGLAEMLKHGLIDDEKYWNEFSSLQSLTTDDLDSLIYRSVQIKNEIVMQDPTEKGLRKILNFGHTLGHAIESYFLEDADKENLLHGEAIAIGMILEAHISSALKLLPQNEYIQLKGIISSIFPKVEFTEQDKANVIKLLIHDKKNVAGKVQFVLLERIGHAVINKEVYNQLIINAFADYLN